MTRPLPTASQTGDLPGGARTLLPNQRGVARANQLWASGYRRTRYWILPTGQGAAMIAETG